MAGKNFNDRELAAKVRTLALEKVFLILTKGEKHKLFRPIIERLAPTLLPRLSVLSSEEDRPLIVEISDAASRKYGINRSASEDNQ